MNESEKIILKIKQELEKEKTSALKSIKGLEKEKEVKKSELEKDLKAIRQRSIRLADTLLKTDLRIETLQKRIAALRGRKKAGLKRKSDLRKRIKAIPDVGKELKILNERIRSLCSKKAKSLLEQDRLKKQIGLLQGRMNRLVRSLSNISKQLPSLKKRIAEDRAKKKEKQAKQRILKGSLRKLSGITETIKGLGVKEKELISKEEGVVQFSSKLDSVLKKKQKQEKQIINAINKLKKQERKLKRFSL